MSITATYLGDISRVRVEMASISSDADYVKMERSTDGINWTTVRGGDVVPIVAGTAKIDDYEFQAGVQNTYRASYVDSSLITFVASGTHATGNNVSVVPGLPAGMQPGDLMFAICATTTGAGGPAPAGWAIEADYGPIRVYTKRFVTGDTAPTITFTGGAAGASTSAVILAWHNMQPGFTTINGTINSSAQNLTATAPVTADGPNREYIFMAWKANGAATAASTIPNFGSTVVLANALGAGQSLFYSRISAASNIPSVPGSSVTVTGGVAAISRTLMFVYKAADFLTQETVNITPTLTGFWLKNPGRPGLNVQIEITACGEISREARTGLFAVLGRNNPVAVTDVQSSRSFTIEIDVNGYAAMLDMDNRLATGEPLFLQGPVVGDFVPTTYVVTGTVSYRQDAKGSDSLTFIIPMTEVAKPGATVYGDTYIWNDVVTQYATWSAVIAGVTTWSNLIDKVSNSVVIVP